MTSIVVKRHAFARLLALAAIGWLALAALSPRPASAHANLVQSDPPAQSVLTRAPTQVRLIYSEAVDPRSIEVSVLDAQRNRVDQGDAALAPGANDVVAISLNPGLAGGVYTIQWKVTSAVDGHTTLGLVPFTVGDAGTLPPPGSAGTTVETSSSSGGVLGVVARWWTVLAAVTLTGLFAFVPLVLARALGILGSLAVPVSVRRGRVATESDGIDEDMLDQVGAAATGRLLRLAGLVLVLFALGSLLALAVETQTWHGGSLADALGKPVWEWLRETRRGTLWLIRAGLIVTVGAGLVAVTRDVRRSGRAAVARWWTWAALAGLSAAALLTFSLGSHSAALRSQESSARWVVRRAPVCWPACSRASH
jgi:methionine-rich copper-binding protein CopC